MNWTFMASFNNSLMASEAEQQENLRFAEKRSNFRGSAKVHLRHLDFEVSTASDSVTAFLDPKNVARLIQVFTLEGCNRLDLEHRVPVVINAQILRQSLDDSGVSSGDLLRSYVPPTLTFPANTSLKCLHGRHRIAAAKSFLEVGNKWWTVDFYSDDLSEVICRDIREDYANSRNFCDGDIYRQIRYCQKEQNQLGEGRWFARLSESKRKDFGQLQRREELRTLRSALDRLLPYIGFWPGLQIGTFHRILNLKCSEELEHYLNHIRICWDNIIDQREDLQPLIDYQTVKLLQSRCPKTSASDNGLVVNWMQSRKLFPMILDLELRSRILKNIQETEYLIPSLHTFLEDTKWLEPCARIVRRLLPKKHKSSIRRSLFNCYTGVQQNDRTFRVQQRDLSFTEQCGSELQAVESGYRQLWLFAWRHFPELSATLPRKDAGKPKPQARASNERCWQQLAWLAISLGFESEEINQFNSQDPDSRMALDFLSQARPSEFYHMTDEARTAPARQICEILKSIEQQASGIAERTSEPRADDTIPVDHRCGRPHEQSHNLSKAWFFVNEIYLPQASESLSRFTLNRDIFRAFFGFASHLGVVKDASVPDVDRSTELNENPRTFGRTLQDFNFTFTKRAEHDAQPQTRPQAQPQAQPQAPQAQAQAPRDQEQEQEQEQVPESGPGYHQESDFALQTQTVDDNSAAALLDAESLHSAPQNVPDLEATDLVSLYEKQCKFGDLFLVWIDGETHSARGKHIPVDSTTKTGRVPPESILIRANDHYFNAYSQSQDISELKCIEIENIYEYVKGFNWDGVVYAFKHNGDGVALKNFRGRSTSARLHELELIAKKRPRSDTDDGPRKKIRDETEDVEKILTARKRRHHGKKVANFSAINAGFIRPSENERDSEEEL